MIPSAFWIDPLQDARWSEFIDRQSASSIFHAKGWLEALRETYHFEPVVLTSSVPDDALQNGIVLCRTESWLTGRKLVSLPFSDHCELLTESEDNLNVLLSVLQQEVRDNRWKYLELRPCQSASDEVFIQNGLHNIGSFYYHSLDLHPPLEQLFHGLHKDCIRRKIHRAERDQVQYDQGRSDSLLSAFYKLQLITRRRLKMPPQPFKWFKNLRDCLGDKFLVRIASNDGKAIAGIITLHHQKKVVYKYGCSDARYHPKGAMPFLFWKIIQESKMEGFELLDLGRTNQQNAGLATFKDRLGAQRTALKYYRFPAGKRFSTEGMLLSFAKEIIGKFPSSIMSFVSRTMYRHFS